MATSTPKSRNAREIHPRHVWLAGLGLASVLRREAMNAGARALARVIRLQHAQRGFVTLRKA